MLTYLQFLESAIGPLRLFQFISVRSVLAGLLALLFGLFLTACGDDVANDSADAELPPLTEEAAEEAAAEEAPAEQSAE